ncbi:MAG: 4Fe-4S binding protein [Desulfobacterales bacterium]|nr:4Fe-4S binding protein [Desulfobacterales bacterium]
MRTAVDSPRGLSYYYYRHVLSDQDDSVCIKCLYCYMVCPRGAIQLEGTFGFLQAQIDKYDPLIRRIV